MLQLILPPTENVLPGNKERRTNEKKSYYSAMEKVLGTKTTVLQDGQM